MAETVILIDGEYLRKIFMNNGGHRINLPKFIETIRNKLKINENNLLRTYFYTSPPYQGTKPSPEEKIKYQNFQKFLNFLEKQDSLEVRLGRTEKSGNLGQANNTIALIYFLNISNALRTGFRSSSEPICS